MCMNMPELDLRSILDAVQESVVVLNPDLHVIMANRDFYRTFQIMPMLEDRPLIFELGDKRMDMAQLREALQQVQKHGTNVESIEVTCIIPKIGCKNLLVSSRPTIKVDVSKFPKNHLQR